MNLQEQCTTVEQSKKLLELGFYKDTASLNWRLRSEIDKSYEDCITLDYVSVPTYNLPCWTIADMMYIVNNNMKEIYFEEAERCHKAELIVSDNRVSLRDKENCDCDDLDFYEQTLLRDNLFDCLVWLKENKVI